MERIEYVDIYDRNKNKTGIKKRRYIDPLEKGEYIIGVQLVILNHKNEILITKRSEKKKVLPGKWECNGGAIHSSETPLEGLEREIKEELGIEINPNKLLFYKTTVNDETHNIKEIYLYKDNIDIKNLKLSEEVSDAKYVSIEEYKEMYHKKEIVYNNDFDEEDYKKAIQLVD